MLVLVATNETQGRSPHDFAYTVEGELVSAVANRTPCRGKVDIADAPFAGCRIPASWKVLYKDGENWVPVKNTTEYKITKDKYDTIKFEPVKTKALRVEIKLPADYATGVHEWSVK